MRPVLRLAVLAAICCISATNAAAQYEYPEAPRAEDMDDFFGRRVADPYRLLEDADAPSTRQWIEAQNALTQAYLGGVANRDSIRGVLTKLWDYPRTETPIREAGRIWYRKNSGLQKQSVLYRTAQSVENAEVVLDPNALSADGSLAVGQWSVSPDGRLLAYSVASGGADLRDIRLRDLATGRDLPDLVSSVKFTAISWTKDSKGFFFSRFRSSERRANLRDPNTHQTLYYHLVGARADRPVFQRTDDSTAGVGGLVSDDGRWLYISSAKGTSNNRLWVADLGDPQQPDVGATPAVVAAAADAFYRPLGVVGETIYFHTNWEAPNGRIVAATVGDTARAHWRSALREATPVIDKALLVGDRFVVAYQMDVKSQVKLFDLEGLEKAAVTLPDVGTANNFTGRNGDEDFFFTFSSYLRPPGIYRYDMKAMRLEEFERAETPFDPSRYETRFAFYPSKDGTEVPIFITYRKGIVLDGRNPTILHGYGGFNLPQRPNYSPAIAGWLELGGVYAVANLRGGSEYGEAWHRAGMRGNKQNVFDDFIAAAEFLIRERYTSSSSLAISGGSNGGLLVGAAMTQRPDLFAVALPAAAVMDMMRYQNYTGGRFWVEEYGSSEDSSAIDYLLAYSPLHNLRAGTCYPATLVTAADHDDRVVPAHSFKFAAALQKAHSCGRPTMIRVETRGSHNFRTTEQTIAEYADRFAFALANFAPRRLSAASP